MLSVPDQVLLIVVGTTALALILFFIFSLWDQIRAAVLNEAPFVSAPEEAIDDIVAALDPQVGDAVYDLGCGDGIVLRALHAANPKARYIGIEKGMIPFVTAKWRCKHLPRRAVKIRRDDFFETDLCPANKVYVYLYAHVLDMLLPKFKRELPKGAIVVSLDYQFSDRKPDKVITLDHRGGARGRRLSVYRF